MLPPSTQLRFVKKIRLPQNHEYQAYICPKFFVFIPIWKAMSLSLGYLREDRQSDRNEKNFQPNVESLRILLFLFCIFKHKPQNVNVPTKEWVVKVISNRKCSCKASWDFKQFIFCLSTELTKRIMLQAFGEPGKIPSKCLRL